MSQSLSSRPQSQINNGTLYAVRSPNPVAGHQAISNHLMPRQVVMPLGQPVSVNLQQLLQARAGNPALLFPQIINVSPQMGSLQIGAQPHMASQQANPIVGHALTDPTAGLHTGQGQLQASIHPQLGQPQATAMQASTQLNQVHMQQLQQQLQQHQQLQQQLAVSQQQGLQLMFPNVPPQYVLQLNQMQNQPGNGAASITSSQTIPTLVFPFTPYPQPQATSLQLQQAQLQLQQVAPAQGALPITDLAHPHSSNAHPIQVNHVPLNGAPFMPGPTPSSSVQIPTMGAAGSAADYAQHNLAPSGPLANLASNGPQANNLTQNATASAIGSLAAPNPASAQIQAIPSLPPHVQQNSLSMQQVNSVTSVLTPITSGTPPVQTEQLAPSATAVTNAAADSSGPGSVSKGLAYFNVNANEFRPIGPPRPTRIAPPVIDGKIAYQSAFNPAIYYHQATGVKGSELAASPPPSETPPQVPQASSGSTTRPSKREQKLIQITDPNTGVNLDMAKELAATRNKQGEVPENSVNAGVVLIVPPHKEPVGENLVKDKTQKQSRSPSLAMITGASASVGGTRSGTPDLNANLASTGDSNLNPNTNSLDNLDYKLTHLHMSNAPSAASELTRYQTPSSSLGERSADNNSSRIADNALLSSSSNSHATATAPFKPLAQANGQSAKHSAVPSFSSCSSLSGPASEAENAANLGADSEGEAAGKRAHALSPLNDGNLPKQQSYTSLGLGSDASLENDNLPSGTLQPPASLDAKGSEYSNETETETEADADFVDAEAILSLDSRHSPIEQAPKARTVEPGIALSRAGRLTYTRECLFKLQDLSTESISLPANMEDLLNKRTVSSFRQGYLGSGQSPLSMKRPSIAPRVIEPPSAQAKLHHSENAWLPSFISSKSSSVPSAPGNDNQPAPPPEPDDLKTLQRKLRGLLNKVTPEKFRVLVEQILNMMKEITTMEKLEAVVDLIFEKAISEPNFAISYAHICKNLITIDVKPPEPETSSSSNASNPSSSSAASTNASSANTGNTSKTSFRYLLITRCQREFESRGTSAASGGEPERGKGSAARLHAEIDKLKKDMEALPATETDKRARIQEDIDEFTAKLKRRALGNVKFIGELFKLEILNERIAMLCISHLFSQGVNSNDEDSFECLCKLLFTIGAQLESKAVKKVEQILREIESQVSSGRLSTRIKCLMQDVLELRSRQWKLRLVAEVTGGAPKTLSQIHREAEAEEAERRQYAESMPPPPPMPPQMHYPFGQLPQPNFMMPFLGPMGMPPIFAQHPSPSYTSSDLEIARTNFQSAFSRPPHPSQNLNANMNPYISRQSQSTLSKSRNLRDEDSSPRPSALPDQQT